MPALARCRPFGAPLAILSIAALSTVAFALASPSRPAAVSQSDSRPTTSPPDPLPTLYALKGEVLDIRSVTLDLDRGSDEEPLPLRVTFPVATGSYPLIVFSHGAGGSRDTNKPLVQWWCRAGYVCVQPSHGDSIQRRSWHELRRYDSPEAFTQSRETLRHWLTRPNDITTILDQLDEIEETVDGLAGKIDRERIAMTGHSFGAHTTQLLAGLEITPPGARRSRSFADDRIDCFIAISPQGTGPSVKPDAWRRITRPMLMITGSRDDSPRTGQDVKWRMEAWRGMPAGDAWLLYIEDAEHNFGGISGARYRGSGADRPDHVHYVRSVCLAFLDAHLKERPEAIDFVNDDEVGKQTNHAARLERKAKAER